MVRNGDTISEFNNFGDNEFERTYQNSGNHFNNDFDQKTQGFSRDYSPEYDSGNFKTIIIDTNQAFEVSDAWMIILKGRNAGREYSIPPKGKPGQRRVAIGRSSINDIVLDDPTISDEHAFIISEKNTYTLGDAGSLNGTFLNGKKISSFCKLSDGDNLIMGETELEFKSIFFSKKNSEKEKIKNKKTSSSKNKKGNITKKASDNI